MTDNSLPTGALPDGWHVATLGDLTSKIGSGATPRGGAKVYTDVGVSFIRSQNVYDGFFTSEGLVYLGDDAANKLKGVTVERGDVLLNITGDSILRCCVVNPDVLPARVSQHVAIVRSNGSLEPILIQKYLTLPKMKSFMLGHSSGGTRKAITKGHIESFPIPVPPEDIQKALSSFFSTVDSKLESARSVRLVVREMCEVLSLLGGESVPWTPLRELANHVKASVSPNSLDAPLVDHYSLPAFDDGERPERTPPASIKSNKLAVDGEAVLLARLNPRIPRMWWVEPDARVTSMCSTEFMVLRPTTGASLAEVWLACAAPQFWSEMRRRATGTSGSHQRVRPEDVLDIEVPDFREASDEYKHAAEAALRASAQLARESWALEELQYEVTPALFSGELVLAEGHAV